MSDEAHDDVHEESPAAGPGLTTGAVARKLGVAPTTLRSWDRRYGIGPAERGDGRHRRWSPADVAMLERMCRLTSLGVPPGEAARRARAPQAEDAAHDPAEVRRELPPAAASEPRPRRPERPAAPTRGTRGRPDPPHGHGTPGGRGALPLGSVRPECRGLANAAVRLDAPALDALLHAAVEEHGLLTAWDEVIMPALRAVGRKWATSGERYVEVEHLMSWHISTLLRRMTAGAPVGEVRQPVLLACAPDETHSLPLEALAAGLTERGLPVRMFGAAVPPDALDEAVRRIGPAAVVLWSQSRVTADRRLARRVQATAWGVRGARQHPALLLAGPGWAGAGRVEGAGRPLSLRAALDTLTALWGALPAGPPG
ncbi:MerR family transcriptional regulator [Streptomyces sp. OF3]|uniref:MerR family transcriptional regulator n=1 Tax=Streptomyces alkaliterrae TaxID=2213162 RepID=A0A7W3WKR4_9ACTN|nr:MerR family transcriptional regulator [Streptomyces alkaliterrae]MBB1254178.1 MerR family transcriptional regulator [Streptomyces alkaliterrae]